MGGLSGGIQGGSPSGDTIGVKKVTQTLTLNSWNTVTHSLGTTYEVIDIQCTTSSDNNLGIDNWEKVDGNNSRVRPVGSGTLSNVNVYVYYRIV